MQKISISVVAILAILAGANYYTSNKAEVEFNKAIDMAKQAGITIENEIYNKGFFSSAASFIASKNEIKTEINADIKSDIFTFLSQNPLAKISVKALDETTKSLARSTLGSDEMFEIFYKQSISGDKNLKFSLKNADFKESDNEIKSSGFWGEINLNSDKFVKDATLNIDNLLLKSPEFKAQIIGLNAKTIAKTDINLAQFFNEIAPYESHANGKQISIETNEAKAELNGLKYDGQTAQNGDLLGGDDVLKFENFIINGVKFNDIKISSNVQNLSVSGLNAVLLKLNDPALLNDENSFENFGLKVRDDLATIIAKNPKFGTKIEAKNYQNANMTFKLDFGFDGFNGKINDDFNPIKYANFGGFLEFSPNLNEFFAQIPAFAILAGMFNELFVSEANAQKMAFRLDKNTEDLVFNDKISLKEILGAFSY